MTLTAQTAKPQPGKAQERVLVVPKRPGPGAGAGRLTPDEPEPAARYEPALPIDCILAFALNPRTEFDEEPLAELAGSIERCGVLQPLLVRTGPHRHGKQFYDLVAGERRLRAAQAAGLTTVPAIIRQGMLHTDAVFAALAENLHRQDLTSIEIAQCVRTLQRMSSPALTLDKVAKQMGLNASNLSVYLQLLALPESVQALIRDRRLVFSSAKCLYYYWRKHPEMDVLAAAEQIADGKIGSKLLERDFAFAVFGEAPSEESKSEEARAADFDAAALDQEPHEAASSAEENEKGGRKETPPTAKVREEVRNRGKETPPILPYLTRSERIVLNLYVQANTTAEVAAKLGVESDVVLMHIARIKGKLKARSLAHVLVLIGAIRLPKEYAMPEDWHQGETVQERAVQGRGQGKRWPDNRAAACDGEKSSIV